MFSPRPSCRIDFVFIQLYMLTYYYRWDSKLLNEIHV